MLNRRKLLTTSTQSCLLLSSMLLLPACDVTDPPLSTEDALLDYARHMQAISYLGPQCLQKVSGPGAQDPDTVSRELLTTLKLDLEKNHASGEISTLIDAIIRDDFRNRRMIEVEGWQLSITECRLAALAALSQGISEPVTPAAAKLNESQFVNVTNWGPQSTQKGMVFNEQPDGHSGIWIKAEGAPASTVLVFDGHVLSTQVYGETLTSGLYGKLMERIINTPGTYTLELLDQTRQIKQPLGVFTVKPGLESVKNSDGRGVTTCVISGWGPEYSFAGQPFNEQPGGNSAFWIKTNCTNHGTRVLLDGKQLRTTLHEGLVTASVPGGHELEAGLHTLEIAPGGTESRVSIGSFRVEP